MTLREELYNMLIENKELTIKEIRFCAEYLVNGLNATKAYLSIYFDNNMEKYGIAAVKATNLLKNGNIKAVVNKVNNEWLKDKREEFERRIINRLEKKAFYDPADFITKTGLPAFDDLKDLPSDLRHCITGVTTKFIGRSSKPSLEVSLTDQYKALEMLAKYITLFKEDITVQHGLTEETEKMLEKIFNENKD
jgi:hypothetical protein